MDFSDESFDRGNFIATLQLLAKGSSILQNHLLSAGKTALYTSKNILNKIIHIYYASKIRGFLTKEVRDNSLPY